MLKRLVCALIPVLAILSPVAAAAHDEGRPFGVTFTGCAEYVGFGPVSMAKAQALVPRRFTVTDMGGVAGIVVRAATCDAISVDGGPGVRAMVSHVGVNIVSPDGSGDINNYTLVYATNHSGLADKLRRMGLPAVYNPLIVDEDPASLPGEAYVSVFDERLPAYSITGTVNAPSIPAFPFLANWWYSGRDGVIKMATDIPLIAFGFAALEFRTSSRSVLGGLIGGNSFSNFPWYNVRGEYATAQMAVTSR